jgi:hypothetical protein
MSTTFSVANFRNIIANVLTGFTTSLSSSNELVGGSASVKVYTGSQPASPDTAATGTLLATYTVAAGALSAASAGTAQLAAAIQATAVASGTAGYARWTNNGGSGVIDGSVGITGSGAAFILDTLSITSAGITTLQNCGIKMPQDAGGTLKLNVVLRNRLLDMLSGAVLTSPLMGKGGTLVLYSGSQPSSPDIQPTGTLLASIPMGTVSVVCYNTASGGAASLTGNQTVNASASGTPGYARWLNGSFSMDGSVGTAATDFIVDSATTTSGSAINLTNATVTY